MEDWYKVDGKSNLFGRSGSFSRRNLAKTAEEFDALRSDGGVDVEFGGNRGVERWLSFELGDYFHLIAIVLIILAFLEERKKGL